MRPRFPVYDAGRGCIKVKPALGTDARGARFAKARWGLGMRFPEPVRQSDDTNNGPVWSRTRHRRSGNPLVGILVTILALFGALTAVLAVKERSVAEGGAIVDGWISAGWNGVRQLAGQAPEAAETAAGKAEEAAARTGDALQAGAQKTAEELKR